MADPTANAAQALLAMLRTDPSNASLMQECVHVALSEDRPDLAQQALELARAGGVKEPLPSYMQAQLLLKASAWEEAASAFGSILADYGLVMQAPDLASTWFGLGYAQFKAGEFENARATLDRALATEAAPPGVLAWMLRSVHRVSGPAEVCQCWESALPHTRDAESAGVASLAYLDMARHEEAASLAALSLAQCPDCVEALVVQAAEELLHGSTDTALPLLEHALRMNPSDGRVWSTLATGKMAVGDLDGALRAYEAATETMSQHIGTWLGMCWIHIIRREFAAAHTCLGRAMVIDDRFGETHGTLAVISALEGRHSEAQKHLTTARRLDAAGFAWRYAEALLAGGAKDPESIETLARRLLSSSGLLRVRKPQRVH